MKAEKIKAVKAELRRMTNAIEALENADAEEGGANDPRNGYYYGLPKYTGQVRRTSMDLTRALSDLRRSN